MTNDEIIQSIQAVKERLFEKGWRKYDAGPEKGPNCIMGAVRWQTGGFETMAYQVVSRVLGGINVLDFNDSNGTTFDDVVDFLDSRIKVLEMEAK